MKTAKVIQFSDNSIINDYPLPISHQYQELLEIEDINWLKRNNQLCQVFEFTIRYCTSIALSQYYTCQDEHRAPSDVDQFVASNITDPKIHICFEIMHKIAKSYLDSTNALVPELNEFSVTRGGGIAEGLHLAMQIANYQTQQAMTPPSQDNRHKTLYQQNIPKLNELLLKLEFLRRYKLVRLIEPTNTVGYWKVNIFMGPQINVNLIEELRILIHPAPGALAIVSSRNNEGLLLAPYSIFHRCGQCESQGRSSREFFVHEHHESGRAIYLGLEDTNGQPHRIPLHGFINQLIESNDRQEGWEQFSNSMRGRTMDQLRHLQEKYDPALYALRENIEARFYEFIISNKTGFLVVGDSGIGKTNLLCHLATNQLSKDNIVILENCAAWDPSATASGLDKFLVDRYALNEPNGFIKNLVELYRSVIDKHQIVILFLDAVNEFADPPKLLSSLYNHIIAQSENLNWLKIVISCRSESWARMEGSFQGERRFFASKNNIVHRLSRFDEVELAAAYRVYKEKYDIKTDFDGPNGLSSQVKRFIAFPLMLRLVAESNRGEPIPPVLKSRAVFEKYVKLKIGELDPTLAHISLNEHKIIDRIVKLMLEKSTDRLELSSLFDDENIGQLVIDKSITSAYIRLLDKGVLLEVGELIGQKQVRFTYDQVFEFLLAGQIWPESPNVENVRYLVEQGIKYHSLWGAIKISLSTRSLEDDELSNDQLLVNLSLLNDLHIRGMLTDVFVSLANESINRKDQVMLFIRYLLLNKNENSGILAIEVAHRIGAIDLLEKGVFSTQSNVRQMATQYIFFIWQRDSSIGSYLFKRILSEIRQQFSLKGIPKLVFRLNQGIEGVLGLRALIDLCLLTTSLVYRYPDAVTSIGETLLNFIDNMPKIIKAAINPIVKSAGGSLLADLMENGIAVQVRSMRPFFDRSLTDNVRRLSAEVVQHTDPDSGSLQGKLGDMIFELAQEFDGYSYICCIEPLMTRVAAKFESLFEFCQTLYSGNLHSRYIALRVFTMTTYMEIGGPYFKQKHLDFCNTIILDFLRNRPTQIEYPWKETSRSPRTINAVDTSHIQYGCLLELANRRTGKLDFIQIFRQLPWVEPEWLRTKYILRGLSDAVMEGVATSIFNVLPILETATDWFQTKNEQERQYLADAFCQIRSFFPSQVDAYLSDAPAWLRVKVTSDFRLLPLERIGNAGMQVGQPWLLRAIPEFRQAFVEEMSTLALHSTDGERDLPKLGERIIDIDMLRKIALALRDAGKKKTNLKESF